MNNPCKNCVHAIYPEVLNNKVRQCNHPIFDTVYSMKLKIDFLEQVKKDDSVTVIRKKFENIFSEAAEKIGVQQGDISRFAKADDLMWPFDLEDGVVLSCKSQETKNEME